MLATFDPIGALIFGVVSGLIAGTIIVGWVLFISLRAHIRGKREQKNKENQNE